MGKYGEYDHVIVDSSYARNSYLCNIANELAEANRLKRIGIELKYVINLKIYNSEIDKQRFMTDILKDQA